MADDTTPRPERPQAPAPPFQPDWASASDAAPPPSGGSKMLVGGIAALVGVLLVGLVLFVTVNGGDGETIEDPPATVDAAPPSTEEAPVLAATTTVARSVSATELARSVVQIVATFPGGACTGSGTFIDESGLILTNSHVVARSQVCPWEQLQIATVDTPDLPPRLLFTATVVVDDPVLDLAVVRIDGRLDGGDVVSNFPPVEIGDSAGLELGEPLRILGFPGIGGETITFSEGTISGFIEQPGLGTRSWVKTDASIAGGNSGGLAADEEGRMVGVPSRAGTGDIDDITDCRLVADTNGDGRIDDDDSCIPIGGFINGIRPIDAALDIIDAARNGPEPAPATTTTVVATTSPPTTVVPTTSPPATAPPAPPPVTDGVVAFFPRFSVQTTNGLPDPEVFVVPAGAPQLCATWAYEGFAPAASFEVAWFIDGQRDQGSVSSGTNQGAVSGEFFGCISNPNGLAAGTYEVRWSVDGTEELFGSIYVGGQRTPLTIGLQNDTGLPLCFVTWTPIGASEVQTVRNLAPVQPGARFETTLASGRYRTRIADCDRNIVFEDADTEFTGDLTLTLPL